MTAAVTGAESPIMDWSRFGIAEVEARFATSVLSGLTEAEAHRRQSQYGPNEVQDRGTPTAWRLVLAQFTGVLTLVLLAAGVLSVVLGDLVDAGAIAAIVVLNATLGFFQEYRAERSMAALRRLAAPRVRVRRGGQTLEIPAPELVPGDVVIVETGNVVPADARLLRSSTLRVQEAALTGESEAVEKDADVVLSMAGPLGDRRNMLYSGTLVAYGHGEAVVTATGMATELGRIASLLQSVQHSLTPLQRRLDELGRQLAVAASVLVLVVFTLGLLNGEPWRDMLLVAVSLAVAAIPEALTAVVTIALALGAQRMLARRALVRRLPAVEALGSVQVICSDKTGTLTQNRMTVTVLDLAAGRVNFAQRPERVGLCLAATDRDTNLLPDVDILLMGGALCNDAVLQHDPSEPEVHRALGDPTEGALVLAAACSGILQSETRHAFPRVAELPFDSVRKRMTTVHHVPHSTAEVPSGLAGAWKRWTAEGPAPRYLAATKGALDGMLAVASAAWVEGRPQPIDSALRARIMSAHDELARQGLRILGIALRPLRPVMITGDHPLTARHVARTIGISADDACLTGQELDERTDAELRGLTREISVFARVSPEHKIRLVQAFQHDGQIVAMTGDGVNDAPALKKADIGLVAFRARDTHWQTLVFTTLVFSSLALAVAVRSEKVSFWRRPFSNPALAGAIALTVVLQLAAVYVPFLQTLLRTTPLPGTHMLVAFMAGGVVLLSVEFWKWLLRRS